MSLQIAGVDSSTQSTKVMIVDGEDGTVLSLRSAPHDGGVEIDPQVWWQALQTAGGEALGASAAVGVGAQQHGMVVLDDHDQVIRPASLWNDLRSAPQARQLVLQRGGPVAWAAATGSVPSASFTVSKLRWLAETEPEHARQVASVLLPHDWLTWKLAGRTGRPTTDRGDASGTGYFDPTTNQWLPDLLDAALGHAATLPRVAGVSEIVGCSTQGAAISAGTGDNMAAALGLGLRAGDVAVSIGTSGTAFAVTEQASVDETGMSSGFADATGRFLPLACTVNAARVLETMSRLLGVDHEQFAELALSSPAGANGTTLLPYLDGERTPDRPDASGRLAGLTSRTDRADLARAAVEGLLCSLADAIAALRLEPRRVLLIGGGARSQAVRRIAPAIFGVPVDVPAPGEYVARGAARQAAWALGGAADPPEWELPGVQRFEADPQPTVKERYDALRDNLEPDRRSHLT